MRKDARPGMTILFFRWQSFIVKGESSDFTVFLLKIIKGLVKDLPVLP
jgi:hypothetical protein